MGGLETKRTIHITGFELRDTDKKVSFLDLVCLSCVVCDDRDYFERSGYVCLLGLFICDIYNEIKDELSQGKV